MILIGIGTRKNRRNNFTYVVSKSEGAPIKILILTRHSSLFVYTYLCYYNNVFMYSSCSSFACWCWLACCTLYFWFWNLVFFTVFVFVLCFVITSVMLTAFFLSLEQRHEGQTFGAWKPSEDNEQKGCTSTGKQTRHTARSVGCRSQVSESKSI